MGFAIPPPLSDRRPLNPPYLLPPYCHDDNRIERRVWREMHANVTNNHPHAHIDDLMHEVSVWLRRQNRSRHKATVAELREAI